MILLPAAELTEGMIIAQEVRDKNNQLFIPQGATLNATSLRFLRRLDIYVSVAEEGDILHDSGAERDEMQTAFEAAFCQVQSSFQCQMEARKISLDPREVGIVAQDLMQDALADRKRVRMLLDMNLWSERLFQHSFNTAILAGILARQCRYSDSDCHLVALAMFFHDCGQLFLSREVFEKQGRLTDEEVQLVRRHPQIGYQHLTECDILPMEAATIILQHHERPDGTGYPAALTAEQISPLGRIAAVVETFDAMTSLRSYARAASPDEAMKTILSQVGKAFDKEIALRLTKYIILYPEGTAVRLNTGECGIVLGTPSGSPSRPIVRLFFGADGRRIAATEINLAQDTSRIVVHSGANIDAVRAK